MVTDSQPHSNNNLYSELCAAHQTYLALDAIDTFDCPLDHADYRRKMTAHITYLRLQADYIGTPGSAESVIAYLYGKKYARPVTQGNTTRVVFSDAGYDMEDDSDITFDADDFLGPVTRTPVAAPAYLYAPANRPAMYATVPEGFTVVSEAQTDFTPYGVISYPAALDAMTAWKYELKNMFEDYRVGDTVSWVDKGQVLTSQIYQIDDKWTIWADEYTKLPFWALHPVATPAPLMERKLIMGRDGYPVGILDTDVPATPAPVPATITHGQQRSGHVSCYDAKHDYGYIESKGHTFYFQKRNLSHAAMPIKGGDSVTFTVWQMSAHAKPKATGITVEGYIAPVSMAQKSEEQARIAREEQEARRKARRAEQLARRQSMTGSALDAGLTGEIMRYNQRAMGRAK